MALVSPGVQVSVVDESFYTPAEPGTVPVIFCATAQDKTNASGTGTAVGTLAQNAGKPYLLTSQRDLAETFGDPTFQVDANNNPIHGSELNEYGLQSAYSFLGVSNRAWVVRADIDLGSLEPTSTIPTADPEAGTYWLDTTDSLFGIQEWNNEALTDGGQIFTNKVPLVITNSAQTESVSVDGVAYNAPLSSIGEIGDYAVVAASTMNTIWYRNSSGSWVMLGSDDWRDSWPTVRGSLTTIPASGDTLTINDTVVTIGGDTENMTDVASDINDVIPLGYRAGVVNNRIAIYSDGSVSGDDSAAAGPVVIAAGPGADTAALTALGLTAGTYYPPALQISKHTSVPEFKLTDTVNRPTGSIWVKTTTPNAGARWRVKQWNAETRLWEDVEAPIYPSAEEALLELDRTGGGENLQIGDLFIDSNVAQDLLPMASFKIFRRAAVGSTTIRTKVIGNSDFTDGDTYNIIIQSTSPGSSEFSLSSAGTVEFDGAATGVLTAKAIATAITNAGIAYVSAEVDTENRVVIKHSKGGEMKITDGSGAAASVTAMGLTPFVSTDSSSTRFLSYEPGTTSSTTPLQFRASNWQVLSYTPSADPVTQTAEDGTIWYNSIVDEVDIMINDGSVWRGYGSTSSPVYSVSSPTDPNGPIVSASEPSLQSEGAELQEGDLWIDTSDLENYPVIYRYRKLTDRWELIDNSDQTTENGIVFADARWGTSGANGNTEGAITDLLVSDYVDFDAPDPALYPKGTLLFNTRRSGFNVKRYVRNYVDLAGQNTRMDNEEQSSYTDDPTDGTYDRWVTESANQVDGSGSFGRKAQRKVVLQAMQAVINNNDEIRDDESRIFNLISAPGYPELIGEMITLNYDRGLTGFVIGDSPARLNPSATSLNEWATNVRAVVEDNDNGLVSQDEYLGVFYPWGFTSDNFGNNVVVPPSHMMLRTIALSDQVSYPWFAPAGTRRGGITNASSTGYITSEGEFSSVALNEGQRDTLYAQGVNPITFITGAGLVNFGQKTRARGSSSLDRINVARLVIYLRSQLNQLAKPYIFEPNDKITRDEIKGQVDSLLLELVGQRALYDFLVVCDETNNTPARIDRNELYVDIAIEPVKSIEFIYIPLRLKNTGEIAGL
jgi:hypothetical protein